MYKSRLSIGRSRVKMGLSQSWRNMAKKMFNFDTMPNALVTLFVMATTAGWADVVV